MVWIACSQHLLEPSYVHTHVVTKVSFILSDLHNSYSQPVIPAKKTPIIQGLVFRTICSYPRVVPFSVERLPNICQCLTHKWSQARRNYLLILCVTHSYWPALFHGMHFRETLHICLGMRRVHWQMYPIIICGYLQMFIADKWSTFAEILPRITGSAISATT